MALSGEQPFFKCSWGTSHRGGGKDAPTCSNKNTPPAKTTEQNLKAKDQGRNHKDTEEDKEVARAIAEWKPASQWKRTAGKRDKKEGVTSKDTPNADSNIGRDSGEKMPRRLAEVLRTTQAKESQEGNRADKCLELKMTIDDATGEGDEPLKKG